MAKSRSKPKSKIADDEDIDQENVEEEAAEEETAEENAGDEEEAADEEPSEDADEEETPAGPPKPKLSKTTIAFILLNWVAVPLFLMMAYMDHVARLQYSYRTLMNFVSVWGLPLRDEEDFASISNETRPRLRLSPDQLTAAFKKRKNTTPVPKNQEFVPVDEPVPLRLRPSELSDMLLKDIFWDLPDPVATLEDEVERLAVKVPADIESAGKAVVDKLRTDKKSDSDKQETTRKILLPLAWDVWQVKNLDKKIAATMGDDLDRLLEESVQRRLYYDILAPLNVFRTGDLKKVEIEKITDQDLKVEQLKDHLARRLKALADSSHNTEFHVGALWDKEKTDPEAMKRDSIEKRQTIGFLMFTLSQVPVPLLDKKLYPKGIERAQTVCGIREFTNASIYYVRTLRILEERVVESVVADRQGYLTTLKEKEQWIRTRGQIDVHDQEVDQLVKIVEYIEFAEKRLKDLKSQRDDFQKIYVQRVQQHKDQMDKLVAARKNTEKYVKDLRELQKQLHTALVELSDAAERNFALEARIREIELGFLNKTKKGGKRQP